MHGRFFTPGESSGSGDSSIRLLLVALIVAGAYYIGSLIGFALTFPQSAVSVLWPPNAILLTGLLLVPTHGWWVILLGVFPIHLIVQLHSGVPILMSLLWFVSNSAEALTGAVCVRGFVQRRADFASLKYLAIYVGVTILATLLGTFVDASFVSLVGWKGNGYWQTWRTRFPSNVLAALTIPPLIILWLDNGIDLRRKLSWWRCAEASLLGLGLLTTSLTVFYWETVGPGAMTAFLYLPVAFLLWAAARFGQVGAITAFLVVAIVSICGAFQGNGPFISQSPARNVLSLQLFLIATFLPVMFLSAFVEAQKHKTDVVVGAKPLNPAVKEERLFSRLGLGIAAMALCAAYYLGALIGLELQFPSSHFSAFWPANAILLAVLLLYPPRYWLLFLLVGSLARVAAQQGQLGASEFELGLYYVYDGALALTTALATRRFDTKTLDFGNLRHTTIFIVLVTVATGLMAWVCPFMLISLGRGSGNIWLEWRHTFIANLLPFMILTPGIVFASTRGAEIIKRASVKQSIEMIVILAALVGSGVGVFGLKSSALGNFPALLYVPLPFLLWAAVRLGPAGLSLSFLVFAFMAIFNALGGYGPFVTQSPADNIFWLQIFLIVVYLPLLLLASLIEERRDRVQLLDETENRFRNIADTAPIMIWVSGTDKLCTFLSKGWLDFTGRTLEQGLGNGWSEGVHREDTDRCLAIYVECFDKREKFSMEYRLRRHDGEYRWIFDQGAPRFAGDGTFLGYIGSALDITERKRTEAHLRGQNAVTQILSESSSIAEACPRILQAVCECLDWKLGEFWQVQREPEVMVYLSGWQFPALELKEFASASCRWTFSPGEGLPGRVWTSRRPLWIRDLENDDNILRQPVALKTGLRCAFGLPILLGDEVLGVLAFFGHEEREPDRELLEMMANVGSQIGQFINRTKAEQALRESEEQLAQTRTFSLVMMTHSDLDGRWLQVPPSLCQLLGYTEAELLGHSFRDVTHPEDIENNMRQRARLMSREIKSCDLEKRYIRKDGSIVWVDINVSIVADGNGTPVHCLSYIKDISERKRAEEALRENELRLKLAMDAARIGCWEVELSSGTVYRSESFNRIIEAIPQHREGFYKLVHPDDVEGLKKRVTQAIEKLSTYDAEFRIVCPDGTVRWIASRGQVLPDSGGRPSRIVGMSTDISEHKQSEAALQFTLAELQTLRERVEAENVYLRTEVSKTHRHGELIGQSEKIQKVLHLIDQVAPTDVAVLILGETGTGKELVARAVHAKSARGDRPLVKVNCSALPAELIESELFGHEKGAYTGATAQQIGRFELADGGTIFLDEIGDLPLNLQAKLLRVLQEGEFERLGSGKTIKVNARVIAATNRNLLEAIQIGSFRADLYYRLNVYPISMPPLRERKTDIVDLATIFLRESTVKLGKRFDRMPPGVVMALESYDWPGNVRELQNVIERAAVVSQASRLQLPEEWQYPLTQEIPASNALSQQPRESQDQGRTAATLEELEREHILRVLSDTQWKVEGLNGAATILGLQPNTLRSRMKKLGIPIKRAHNRSAAASPNVLNAKTKGSIFKIRDI